MILSRDVAPPLICRKVIDDPVSGPGPSANQSIFVDVSDGRNGSDRIVNVFLRPDGDEGVVHGQVDHQVERHKVERRKTRRCRGVADRRRQRVELVVEKLRQHLLFVGESGRNAQDVVDVTLVVDGVDVAAVIGNLELRDVAFAEWRDAAEVGRHKLLNAELARSFWHWGYQRLPPEIKRLFSSRNCCLNSHV